MRQIGFSTGAVAYGDFQGALDLLASSKLPCIELSALRMAEVETLVRAIPHLDLHGYHYVSFHAPSSFSADEEVGLAELLHAGVPKTWPIVLHPDTVWNPAVWRRLGNRVAVENMDRRKPIGRSVVELAAIFESLPEALLCFDLGHARQCDSSMTDAFLMLSTFQNKLVQVHLSEVNSESQHDPISYGAILAFQQIASLIPESVPVILESRVTSAQILSEVGRAQEALAVVGANNHCYA
jgi:hypothetical protein